MPPGRQRHAYKPGRQHRGFFGPSIDGYFPVGMPGHLEKREAGPDGLEFGAIHFAVTLLAQHLARRRCHGHAWKLVIGGQPRKSRVGPPACPTVEPQVRALGHPVALQPTVVDVEEIVPGSFDGSRYVHHVKVRVARRVENSEGADLSARRQKRGHKRYRPRWRHYRTDIEEPVMAGVPLVEAHHEVARERHRVVEERNRRHVGYAKKRIERHFTDLEPSAPRRGQPGVGAPAAFLGARDDSFELSQRGVELGLVRVADEASV